MSTLQAHLLAALLLGVVSSRAAAQARCLPTGPDAERVRDHYAALVSRTDTASARVRTSYHLIPAAAAQVDLAGDSVTCHAAATAFARERGDTLSPAPVYVIRAGASRYIVFNYAPGTRDVGVIFDCAWTALVFVTGF